MGHSAYVMGKTKIFFKVGVLADIDRYRGEVLSQHAIQIQALARGYAGRKFYQKLRDKFIASTMICDAVRDWITLGQWAWYKLFVRVKPLCPTKDEIRLKKQKEILDELRKQIEELKKQVDELEERAEELDHDKNTKFQAKDELLARLSKIQSEIENMEAEQKRSVAKIEELKRNLERASKDGTNTEEQKKI